jgi:hypothetical protein
MNGKSGYKISAVFVCFKPGFWRAVGLHGHEDLGDSGASAFSEIQFLQKLPNPAIPICVSFLNPNGYCPVHISKPVFSL